MFAEVCSKCHGIKGQGGMHAKKMSDEGDHKKDNGQHNENGPPLWGDQSFTDGAGMSKQKKLASFAYYNMPRHNPTLSEEQALDVAAFVTDQPRPHCRVEVNWVDPGPVRTLLIPVSFSENKVEQFGKGNLMVMTGSVFGTASWARRMI